MPSDRAEDGFDVEVIEEVGMLGLHDRLSRGALGLALKVWVLDSDVEPKLVLLELPSDAALIGQSAPVNDDATTVAANFEGLGLVEVGLDSWARPLMWALTLFPRGFDQVIPQVLALLSL